MSEFGDTHPPSAEALAAITTAIKEGGASQEFMDSRECNRVVENMVKLMRKAYFEGYHHGRLDEQSPLMAGDSEWLILEYRHFINSRGLYNDFAEWMKTQPLRS